MPGRAGFVADPAIYTDAGEKGIEEGAGENPAPFWVNLRFYWVPLDGGAGRQGRSARQDSAEAG